MAGTLFFFAFLLLLIAALWNLSDAGGDLIGRINRWYERRYGMKK